jgi:hypothetical protein
MGHAKAQEPAMLRAANQRALEHCDATAGRRTTYRHLEILDGGRTLSPNQLAEVFGITRESADAIVQFRNSWFMMDWTLGRRLRKPEAVSHRKMEGNYKLGYSSKRFQSASPHGEFYGALMDLFSTYLASQAGIPPGWINRRVALSFYEEWESSA